jgi:hypothetical protein
MRSKILWTAVMVAMASVGFGGPNTITYQGCVVSGGGGPVSDGNYTMRFSIFTVASGGSQVWQETDANVAVTNGLFSTALGNGTPFAALFINNNNLWLEIEIDLSKSGTFETAEKYTPRQKLAGAAWAVNADTVDGRHMTNFWSLTGNAATTSGTHYLGTSDNKPFDIRVNNARGLRIEPAAASPNLLGGHSVNTITSGVAGGTIGGGGNAYWPNRVTADYAVAGGGLGAKADGMYSLVGGGYDNNATGFGSVIAGGEWNHAEGTLATVGGGRSNRASGINSTVGGGLSNVTSGTAATVPGGWLCSAGGKYSFAAGRRAKANNDGSFVWADSQNADYASDDVNQFKVRAEQGAIFDVHNGLKINGGYGMWLRFMWGPQPPGVPSPIEAFNGAYLSAAGWWTNSSDRNVKEGFATVDGREILEQLDRMPICTWNFRAEPASIRRIGPTAQDFRAAFGFGADDKHIATGDADGVALAAIQALYKIAQEKEAKIAAQQQRIADLETRLAAVETMMTSLAGGKKF